MERWANVLAEIDGYANFIFQIEPEKGVLYKKRVNAILVKYNYKEKHKAAYVPKVLDKREKANKPDSGGGIFKKIMSFFKK